MSSGVKEWIEHALNDAGAAEEYANALAAAGYTKVSEIRSISRETLKDVGVTNLRHVDLIMEAKGWQRDLLRECVEPNPGPKGMMVFFDEIANGFDNKQVARDALANLEHTIRNTPTITAGALGYTDADVRRFFTNKTPVETKALYNVSMDIADPIDEEVRSRLSLYQVEDTFPPLGPRVIASSTPALPSEKLHLPAKIKAASFVDEFPLPAVAAVLRQLKGIWGMKYSSDLQWSHEVDIQTFVEFAIRDVLNMYGIDATLAREVSVAQLRPDFWVVKHWGIPIGAIGVKIPLAGDDDTSTLNDERAAGQVLDYLLTLKSSVGLCGPVFAILTTYRSWRIFWLRSQVSKAEETPTGGGLTNRFNELSVSDTSGGQEIADSAHTYEPTNYSGLSFVESLWQQFRQTNSLSSDYEGTAKQSLPATPRKRFIFADSTLYSIANSATLREVVSKALRLMVLNSVHRQPVSLHRNLFLAANERQWLWIEPLPTTFQLRPDKFPNNNTQQIILLADLGSGLHGRVWLACSTGGAVCVVKFFKEDNIKESSPEKELGFWRKIYPHSKARIQTFMDKPALLMPAFPPCPLPQRSTPEVRAAVQRAVAGMLSKGISHGDLKWANFGFYGSGDTLVAHAFDFGSSHEFTEAGKEEATQKATAQLAEMFASVNV